MSSASHGQRNLLILGCAAVIIAGITTSVELAIYRKSGDIYLDRSRPGYLPDQSEVEEESGGNSGFIYPDSGPLDGSELDEYIDELKNIQERLNKLKDPYSPTPLTNESLGI